MELSKTLMGMDSAEKSPLQIFSTDSRLLPRAFYLVRARYFRYSSRFVLGVTSHAYLFRLLKAVVLPSAAMWRTIDVLNGRRDIGTYEK